MIDNLVSKLYVIYISSIKLKSLINKFSMMVRRNNTVLYDNMTFNTRASDV